jgi:succinyl-diaminopimelate desuccinylase
MGGRTYAGRFPCALAYGPGGGGIKSPYGGAHQANEGLWLQSIYDAVKIYVRAALAMDKREDFSFKRS